MCISDDFQNENPEIEDDFAESDEIEYGQPVTLRVGNSIKERRLDKYLHGRFSNLSRNYIQDAIRQGKTKVNGKIAKPSLKLNPGDEISFIVPEPPSREIIGEDIPLNIIHEDDDIIILNKQAGILVHPARSNTHGTLVNALAFYSNELSDGLGEFRPGIVHRLDRNTTGVMVVTKNNTAQWKIAKQFESFTRLLFSHKSTRAALLNTLTSTPVVSVRSQ